MQIEKSKATKSVSNNFYTEKLVYGAYPLTNKHISALKSIYTNEVDFIDKVVEVLTSNGITIQACLLAHFVVLKNLYNNKRFGAYTREGIDASEVKFSFVNITSNGTLMRYETAEQQMLRRAFLTFNMRSANRKKLQKLLKKDYDLQLATMGDCGCCIVASSQLDTLESNQLYNACNTLRSHFNASAIETLEVSVDELRNLDADIHEHDINAMKQLHKVISTFAEIDKAGKICEIKPKVFNAADIVKTAYSKAS